MALKPTWSACAPRGGPGEVRKALYRFFFSFRLAQLQSRNLLWELQAKPRASEAAGLLVRGKGRPRLHRLQWPSVAL